MRPSMNDNVSARNLVGKWEKAGTKDKLGATFKTEPVREKSAMMKKNEKAIGEYRKKFVSRNFKEKPKSRGMSMSKRPAQLKNVFGTELQDLTSYKPPVFPKSEEDISEIRKCISKNIFFNDITEKQQKTFIDAFEPVVVNKGDNLIEQGDVGDYFYVLTEGVVSFTIDGEDAGFASGGESFGDLAMIYSARRAASVAVQSDSNSSNLFRVDQKTFRSLMVKQTRIMEAEKEKLLNSVDFLNNISSIDMKRLAAVLTTRFAQPGETVIQKGSAGDTFFVISEGEVQVTDMSVGSIKFDDMKLSPGDYFGERAIAVDEPRAATVKATKKSILFSISKQAFEKVLGKHSRVIMKSQDKKILEGINLLKASNLKPQQYEELADLVVDKEFDGDETILNDEEETEAAVYILREGSVNVSGGGFDETIKPGGFFGEALLLLDKRLPSKSRNKTIPRFCARTMEPSVCGILYLGECRQVFDTSSIPDLHDENAHYPHEVEDPDSDDEMLLAAPPSVTTLGRETTRQWLRHASCDLLRQNVKNYITLKDFTKHSVLGEGQFGEVWLVSADVLDHAKQYFALKIQHRDDPSRGDSSAVIQREIDVMKQMDHPFLVNFVHQYEDPSKMYILMRLVHGGELFDVIHYKDDDGTWSSGIPEADSKFYAMMISDTLEYLHRKKFVFRDLKPENVLIDKDGYPVICDFGFAKYVEDMTYTLCGTPQYLSPEVILNKGHNFATDHWSLGVVIYEMIAGENPFFFDDMPQMELFESIVRERYYPLADEVSDDAFEVIDGLLRKDPTRRLGALAGRGKDIINMSWFEELDLVELRQKRFEAPFIPHNAEFEEMMKKASPVMPGRLRSSTSAPMTSMRTTSTAPQASFASLEQTFGQRASGGDLIDSSDDEL